MVIMYVNTETAKLHHRQEGKQTDRQSYRQNRQIVKDKQTRTDGTDT